MPAKRILMICGDYSEDYEVMVPFQALLAVDHQVHAVLPGKKAGEQIATAVHDFEGQQTYSEKRGHNFTLNATFADIRPESYDAPVIPVGRAPKYLRLDPKVIEVLPGGKARCRKETRARFQGTTAVPSSADFSVGSLATHMREPTRTTSTVSLDRSR